MVSNATEARPVRNDSQKEEKFLIVCFSTVSLQETDCAIPSFQIDKNSSLISNGEATCDYH